MFINTTNTYTHRDTKGVQAGAEQSKALMQTWPVTMRNISARRSLPPPPLRTAVIPCCGLSRRALSDYAFALCSVLFVFVWVVLINTGCFDSGRVAPRARAGAATSSPLLRCAR